MAVIAIDLGGTKLAAAICGAKGKLSGRQVVPLGSREGAAVGELIIQEIRRLLDFARAKRIPLRAVGLCVPGISHSKGGKVWAPNIPGWEACPLRREVQAAVRSAGLRVAIDSDRAAYILGETWRGAAKGCRHAIFLAVGTGVGAGIMSDGKILRGAHDIAGAAGWLALDRPFRPEYSPCGCFEYHASGEGLGKVAREAVRQRSQKSEIRGQRSEVGDQRSKLGRLKFEIRNPKSETEPSSARDVFAAYDRNDPAAREIVQQAVGFWGMAVANLVSLFNPERIIFGGGVFGPATRFLEDIYAEAKQWAQPISINQVKILPSQLGGDAGLYGAG